MQSARAVHVELRALVVGSLDVFGLAVKSVAVGLAWTAVSHGAVLSEGKRFIFLNINLVKLQLCPGDICITVAIFPIRN